MMYNVKIKLRPFQQVMMDSDLTEIYGYQVKALNQQVKNNLARFPEDFMFKVTKEELNILRSNFLTANISSKSRSLPYAFTEQGIYMLATVLKGPLAEQQSIFIMRAFRELRHYVSENRQFVTQDEMKILSGRMEEYHMNTEKEIRNIHVEIGILNTKIDTLSNNFLNDTDLKEFVIYKDQKFEVDTAYIDIYSSAKKSIYVVDDYVNTKTLELLTHKKKGVEVILFTENKDGKNGRLTDTEIKDFNSEYPTLTVWNNPECHDRFIVLDYGMKSEKIFHCGHSSKDAGNRICAIVQIQKKELVHPMIEMYLKLPERAIRENIWNERTERA